MTKRPLPPTTPTTRPPPIMMSENRPAGTYDVLNLYCTLPQAAALTKWSETMLRKLVNGGFLHQEYRGIIRVRDLIQCYTDYLEFGKGKEVHQNDHDRVVEYNDDE